MSLGSTLREARERKGLTIAQVAEQTRMIHQLVEEIENDDFHRITAPLYGRGFVKLFAECVDVDPAPLMQEFTEIYSGLRRPGVRTRPVQTPVESPDVAEPKDRNAPPPRPKVRHVVVADDPEEVPAAPVESLLDTGRNTSTARPAESPKSEVESPADTGKDTSTARPSASVAPPVPIESPKTTGDAGILPTADGESTFATQGEGPASSGPKRPTVLPSNRPTNGGTGNGEQGTGEQGTEDNRPTVQPSNRPTDEPTNRSTDEPVDDESLLGELFDLVARKRAQRSDEPSEKLPVKEESHVKISLPQSAPSWNDAPLEEDGDFWQKLSNLDKWKYWKIGAALAGLCFLSVIVFAVVAKLHSKPKEAEPPAVSQTPVVSEPQPEQAPSELSTPTLNSNSQPETPSAEAATAASADGKTVYTANLIPPPDSYVE